MMRDFFDRQGNPLTLWQWAEKFSDKNYTRVALATVGACRISTVWIGLNQTHAGEFPLIFETAVLREGIHILTQRYATEDEASAGHELAVQAAMEQREKLKGSP